ncbi:MAG: histidinol dehydrogenase [Rhodospirillales bacterium]
MQPKGPSHGPSKGPLRLDASAADFDAEFGRFLDLKREIEEDVDATAAAIIADVRARGDAAIIALTQKFDGVSLTPQTLRVSQAEIDAAIVKVPAKQAAALKLAAERIESYHCTQAPQNVDYVDAQGVRLGARYRAVDSVGLYVPGGTASYPSSVLMNAMPAKVAGVERIVMVTPMPGGQINPLVLLAAQLGGVAEIYRIGGAQAVAALAYGTASIKPVDKIVGPGNAWVAAAKRRVFGQVGIDLIAGPSEILVVADVNNDAGWIAADLLSQAEHDVASQSVLITDDAKFAERVIQAIEGHLKTLSRAEITRKSWNDYGAIIVVRQLDDAVALVDRIAPEHLELALDDDVAERLMGKVRHAGAIFLGRHTPEAIGDYVAGTNHVLPTSRSARFSSGLGVSDFVKRSSFVRCGVEGLAAIGPAAIALAEAEGLPAHALSVAMRLNKRD